METHVSLDGMEIDCPDVNSLRCFSLKNGGENNDIGHHEDGRGIEGDEKMAASLYTIKPVSRLDNRESVLVMCTSLSSELSNGSNDEFVTSGCQYSPRTPKEGVFNSFAPGPEEMCLAPFKQPVKVTRGIVARQLKFDVVNEGDDDKEAAEMQTDKMLVETVYDNILQLIITKQTKDFLAENQESESMICSTPTSTLQLSENATTCPQAPPKVTTGRKSLNIDSRLCIKLEF